MPETRIKKGPKKLGRGRRQAVTVSEESAVTIKPLREGELLPLLVQPTVPDLNLISWVEKNHASIQDKLRTHGGILFRGFGLRTPEEFEAAVQALSNADLLEYKERSSPRSQVAGRVYTSTDYPPEQPIFLHNENSYQHTWPMRICFFCHTEPQVGGETPIADTRRIYEAVDPSIRQRFEDKGWMYVRNFVKGMGLDWTSVFQTEDKEEVAAYCSSNGIDIEWRDDALQTRALRHAAHRHPETGEWVWFNHATFFHVSTLPETVRAGLESFEEKDLPANTYYGDGSSIESETLDHLRQVYHDNTVKFPWQLGDLLLLDNMLVAHGRSPFEGERKILVGMTDPMNRDAMAAQQAANA